jgi:DNA-binding IclR family transcriptional regulator
MIRTVATTPNPASLELDLARLRSEFAEYPGMCLTVEQVARLLDVPRDDAAGLLAMLESEGLLFHRANGAYRRPSPLLS